MSMQKSRSGFTIVELLIVIVIIAILAAITIVAFRGIQDRAAASQTSSAVTGYTKALMMYANDNGAYPIYSYPCLGGSEPFGGVCAVVSSTQNVCGNGQASSIAAFDTTIKQYVSKLPVPSSRTYTCGGQKHGGAFYFSTDGKTANMSVYYPASITNCPAIGGTINSATASGEALLCSYQLTLKF